MHEWKSELVSIVMPAYNSQTVLAESIQSVMAQTYRNWELLIVDDSSKDETLAIAREFARKDDRIRIVPLKENRGVAEARNIGVEAAHGRYLAFLDSDDLWLPNKLEVQIKFMQDSGAGFTYAQYRRMSVDGSIGKPVRISDRVTYEELLRGNVIGCLTVAIDREQIPDVSMPPIKHEDYVAWLAILKRGNVAWGIQQDLARYRVTSASVSADKKRSAGWTWNIYRHVEHLSLVKSAWCFINYMLRAIYVRLIS